jgi:hypothetical protein
MGPRSAQTVRAIRAADREVRRVSCIAGADPNRLVRPCPFRGGHAVVGRRHEVHASRCRIAFARLGSRGCQGSCRLVEPRVADLGREGA